MFISIIIPTLNEEEYLGQLLHQLTKHPDKEHFEVVVVDGGSCDRTLEIANHYKVLF